MGAEVAEMWPTLLDPAGLAGGLKNLGRDTCCRPEKGHFELSGRPFTHVSGLLEPNRR